jgi:alkanesulfonate monooxygenase SsuD/methylene tetrahydromethanopterin reductase-like flavin-dependent oxidoreductase (luciferase family)
MEIGIGLPSTIPSATGADVLTWARDADEAGFSTLGTLDRIVYGNHETIPTLAAAAAVTSRVRLTTAILISPYRGNGTLLAKQLATIDSFAKGRLTIGIAVGGRDDDYTATGSDFHSRGADFDNQLTEMHAVWAGESRGTAGAVGPAPQRPGGVPLLIGGQSPAAYRRVVSHGAGWIAGGGGPSMFAQAVEPIRQAWKEGGRTGAPRLVSLGYYALGPNGAELAEGYLRDYYAFAGPYVDMVVSGAATSEAVVREQVAAYADAGCDELILFPCSPDPDQLKRLADVTLG